MIGEVIPFVHDAPCSITIGFLYRIIFNDMETLSLLIKRIKNKSPDYSTT